MNDEREALFDCAVIGAGLAGLAAAAELTRRGHSVVVLEARQRVGGRIENGSLSDGEMVELGGQWIGPGHDVMVELANDYGLELIGLPTTGELTVRLQGRTFRMASKQDSPMMTPFEVADLGQGVIRFRRLGGRLETDPVWAEENQLWLGQDLQRWIETNLRTPGGQRYFREVFESASGSRPEGLSLGEGLRQAASGVDFEGLVAANGGLYQMRVRGGVAEICRHLAEDLGERVRLGVPVGRIVKGDDEARVVLTTGEEIRARRVLCTLPPPLAMLLEHEPPLPEERIEMSGKVAKGHVIKSFLVYDHPWWRDLGLSGQMGSDEGAVRVTLDSTLEDSTKGVLLGFFEGPDAEELAARSAAERKQAFIDSMVKSFGQAAADPIEYIERDWSGEKYTGSTHGAHFAPGVWTVVGPQLGAPDGVEYFAGAEYSPKFNGYMEGAVRSGREVAAAIARSLS